MKAVKRSPCPVACTLDIIGDKWTLFIIRDMTLGRTHFRDFIASPEGIATNILSDRLARPVESGLAQKYPSTECSGRDAYRLTKKGESLLPILKAVAKWGLENIPGTEQRMQPK